MARQVSRTDGLRQLLIDDYDERVLGWYRRHENPAPDDHVARQWARVPGAATPPKEVLEKFEALKAGQPVEVGSGTLMSAMLHAGLPEAMYRRFCNGGADHRKRFVLDEQDRLTELA